MSRFALALVILFAISGFAPASQPGLTPGDARYLEKLIADFLFDPTGAERVTGEFPYHSSWGTGTHSRDGWLVRGKGGSGDRVYFTGGESQPAPPNLIGIDFVAACAARYSPRPANETPDEAEERHRRSSGVSRSYDLALAAWLHKFGRDALAAKALAAARAEATGYTRLWAVPEPRAVLRFHLASELFDEFVEAVATYRDEPALELGARLFKLYPDVIRQDIQNTFWQAESVLGDLQRRKAAGTPAAGSSRVAPSDLPAEGPERIAALIGALEDINARRATQRSFGETPLSSDWRVRMLVEIGEPAVPALIDAFDKDNRRTRSLEYPSVRQPILVALRGILRVHVVNYPSSAELMCYPAGRSAKLTSAVNQLRTYWTTYGTVPFDERMMKVLTDPNSPGSACQEAMWNLVALNDEVPAGWLSDLFGTALAAKFSNPTVAEAILAARDRYLKAGARSAEPETYGRRVPSPQSACIDALVRLGDRRIAPVLARLAGEQTNLASRLQLARAAFQLGRSQPLRKLAREIETGTFKLSPPAPSPSVDLSKAPWRDNRLEELGEVIRELSEIDTEFADRALWALADPKHPLHRATVALLVRRTTERGDERAFWHPYWILVAQSALCDTTPTGRVYRSENERVLCEEDGSSFQMGYASELERAELRRQKCAERVCDRLALKLSRALIGAPEFHPLRTDSEDQLAAVMEFVGRYGRRFRVISYREADWLRSGRSDRACCVPDLPPLNRAATVADIGSGDAVFHLNGKGEPAAVAELPIWVSLKDGTRGLAVQAEIGPGGSLVYGVFFEHGMGAVPAEEVETTMPVVRK
jgi:hypothetical protein